MRDEPARRLKADLMHIMVVIHDFQPGGVERIAIRLASWWAADGVRVTVTCGTPTGPLKPLLSERVSLIAPARELKRARFSRLRLALFAARVARQSRPDVIFLPGNYYVGVGSVMKLVLGRGCPRIVSKLSNPLHRGDRGRFRQWTFDRSIRWKTKFSDHLVFMSSELQEDARTVIQDVLTKSIVIPQPVLDRVGRIKGRVEAKSDEAIELMAAGRLVPQKNIGLMIDALARLGTSSVKLTIFGEGPDRAKLETKITMLGLERHVELAGYTNDWQDRLQQARLFLLSSNFEGFPSVVIEALAAGVPVIATDCSPAIHSILKSDEFGTVVATGDPEAFACAIVECLRRSRPEPSVLAKSVENFQLERSAQAYLSLFRELSQARASSRPS